MNDIEIDLASVNSVSQARALATRIVECESRGRLDHWARKTIELLTGMILYVVHTQKQIGRSASLANIEALLAKPAPSMRDLWTAMAAMSGVSAEIASVGEDMLELSIEEQGAVLTVARTVLAERPGETR